LRGRLRAAPMMRRVNNAAAAPACQRQGMYNTRS
jgi:hypothetical protein